MGGTPSLLVALLRGIVAVAAARLPGVSPGGPFPGWPSLFWLQLPPCPLVPGALAPATTGPRGSADLVPPILPTLPKTLFSGTNLCKCLCCTGQLSPTQTLRGASPTCASPARAAQSPQQLSSKADAGSWQHWGRSLQAELGVTLLQGPQTCREQGLSGRAGSCSGGERAPRSPCLRTAPHDKRLVCRRPQT